MNTKISNPLKWEELVSVLDYCSITGIFTWKETRGRILKGSTAGYFEDDGYITIRLNRKLYKAHRLAWFYSFKEWPTKGLDIDHINRVRSDNSLGNLREVSRADNNRNSVARNYLGIKHIYPQGSKFYARLNNEGKDVYIGTFESIELAQSALAIYYKENNL